MEKQAEKTVQAIGGGSCEAQIGQHIRMQELGAVQSHGRGDRWAGEGESGRDEGLSSFSPEGTGGGHQRVSSGEWHDQL